MHLKEALLLSVIYFKTKIINFVEYLRVIFKYYRKLTFFKIDTSLLSAYLFTNPFRLSKRCSLEKGESDLYTYGETPLTTLELIAQACDLTPRDVVVEMGCGRGRTCFWLNQFVGCRVIGIDHVPKFIQKGQRVKERFHLDGIEFRMGDLFQADLSKATVIYLYGTCYSTDQITQLINRFSELPEGTKIITVSYALNEYRPSVPFSISKQFQAPFTWGFATVFLQIKQKNTELSA